MEIDEHMIDALRYMSTVAKQSGLSFLESAQAMAKLHPENEIVCLIDGPMNGTVLSGNFGDVLRVDDPVFVEENLVAPKELLYVRGERNAAYTKYHHMTQEQFEQRQFENALVAAGNILESDNLRVRVDLGGPTWNWKEELKCRGFQWNPEKRTWFVEGTRDDLAKQIAFANTLRGVRISCSAVS